MRFFLQVIENKDVSTFRELTHHAEFVEILYGIRRQIPRGGVQFLRIAQPFVKHEFLWRAVVQGILSLDYSEDKRKQLAYAEASTENPEWDQILSIKEIWSEIATSNDTEMAEAIIPWEKIDNQDKDMLLYMALKRATNKRHPNDAMLCYIHQRHKSFSTLSFDFSTFEVARIIQHPLGRSILFQSSRIKIIDGWPPTPSSLDFLLEHEGMVDKNELLTMWIPHPQLRGDEFMKIWKKHGYSLFEVPIPPQPKRKRFSFH